MFRPARVERVADASNYPIGRAVPPKSPWRGCVDETQGKRTASPGGPLFVGATANLEHARGVMSLMRQLMSALADMCSAQADVR
jgi:hypothetical protein